jgi:hypothetical protein
VTTVACRKQRALARDSSSRGNGIWFAFSLDKSRRLMAALCQIGNTSNPLPLVAPCPCVVPPSLIANCGAPTCAPIEGAYMKRALLELEAVRFRPAGYQMSVCDSRTKILSTLIYRCDCASARSRRGARDVTLRGW